jgi:hypothetical protein
MAITLAPPGTHHVTISGGDEVYNWDKGDASDDAGTWVYDRAAVDPKTVLADNAIVPDHFSKAERATVDAAHRKDSGGYVLRYDSGHELQKTSQGYVYVVRPGAPNEKFYSFIFY